MDRKWKLKASYPDPGLNVDLFYRTDDDWNKEILFVDRATKTIRVKHDYFELKDPALYPQREKEPDDWLRNSAKYGHWQMEEGSIDLETAKFILEILQKLESEAEE